MLVEALLERLDGVVARGAGQWSARCPAHEDRSPSLSVRETDEGTVLIHCFAGCSPEAVTGALGLALSDLFTKPHPGGSSPLRDARWDALRALRGELTVGLYCAAPLLAGNALPREARARLCEAVQRVREVGDAL